MASSNGTIMASSNRVDEIGGEKPFRFFDLARELRNDIYSRVTRGPIRARCWRACITRNPQTSLHNGPVQSMQLVSKRFQTEYEQEIFLRTKLEIWTAWGNFDNYELCWGCIHDSLPGLPKIQRVMFIVQVQCGNILHNDELYPTGRIEQLMSERMLPLAAALPALRSIQIVLEKDAFMKHGGEEDEYDELLIVHNDLRAWHAIEGSELLAVQHSLKEYITALAQPKPALSYDIYLRGPLWYARKTVFGMEDEEVSILNQIRYSPDNWILYRLEQDTLEYSSDEPVLQVVDSGTFDLDREMKALAKETALNEEYHANQQLTGVSNGWE
ncbi:hypothetical protein LTR62_006456 [Meristemomyces frigidus]|uniref:Uncharacterized protein n=1 Tax=Meristemomyces frigidus TaxID=1508187 RepID=A0AAN7TDE6_9PEZI|nr:hypothetical protein LTR62_006456 [Meristemomyces frigidus]